MNRVEIQGRLGQDPEVRFTASGTPVANFSVATDERYTKNGEALTKTTWHRVVAWGKLAELCGESLKKGQLVSVSGKLSNSSWADKDGTKRYKTEVEARSVFGVRQLNNKTGATSEVLTEEEAQDQSAYVTDEDIPF